MRRRKWGQCGWRTPPVLQHQDTSRGSTRGPGMPIAHLRCLAIDRRQRLFGRWRQAASPARVPLRARREVQGRGNVSRQPDEGSEQSNDSAFCCERSNIERGRAATATNDICVRQQQGGSGRGRAALLAQTARQRPTTGGKTQNAPCIIEGLVLPAPNARVSRESSRTRYYRARRG